MQENNDPVVEPVADVIDAFAGISQANLIAAGVLIAAIIAALILHWLVYKLLLKGAQKSRSNFLFRLLRKSRFVARLAMIILAIELTYPLITMPDAILQVVNRLISLSFIGVCGWLIIMIIRGLTDARLSRYDLNLDDNLEARKVSTRMRVLRQMLTMLVILVTAGAMLMTFPSVRSIGVSLFASAGVAGIVVGFAARPVLSNLLAGIQIALTQPIRIGDAVIMEGEWGWIEEITSTYVVVKIWDWRRLVVPLTQIIEKPFQNWTRETSSIIGNVFWHLDYTAPIDEMRVKLKQFLEESELWDRDVQVLQVTDTAQDTISVRALMSAKNSPTAWDLRCEIREKMITWLQAEHPGALPRTRGQLQIDQSDIKLTRPKSGRRAAYREEDRHMGDKIGYPEDEQSDALEDRQPSKSS